MPGRAAVLLVCECVFSIVCGMVHARGAALRHLGWDVFIQGMRACRTRRCAIPRLSFQAHGVDETGRVHGRRVLCHGQLHTLFEKRSRCL